MKNTGPFICLCTTWYVSFKILYVVCQYLVVESGTLIDTVQYLLSEKDPQVVILLPRIVCRGILNG